MIRINGTPGDSLNAYLPKVKGKWLMLNDPASIWNPDGPPMTAADSQAAKEAQEKRASTFQRLQGDPKAMQEFRQASYDRAYQLKAAGALGIITDGSKEQGLMNMSGSPNSVSPLPNLVVSHEDYAMFDRLIKRGNPPVLAGNVTNTHGHQADGAVQHRSARSRAARSPMKWSSSERTSTAGTSAPASPTTAPVPWWCWRRRAPSRSRA